MYTAKVSARGRIVIPKPLREKHGLAKGAQVQVVDYDGILTLVLLQADPVEVLHGMLAGGPSLTKDLRAERARGTGEVGTPE